jgi:hypothetical protein
MDKRHAAEHGKLLDKLVMQEKVEDRRDQAGKKAAGIVPPRGGPGIAIAGIRQFAPRRGKTSGLRHVLTLQVALLNSMIVN